MNILIGLIVGLIVGFILGWVLKKPKTQVKVTPPLDSLEVKEKEMYANKRENLGKIKEYIKGKDKITNNDIQKLLKISDASATRYLEELEKEGLIRQINDTGRGVYYQTR